MKNTLYEDLWILVIRSRRDFYAHSKNCEKRILPSFSLSVHPSVWTEQLGSHSTDFFMKLDLRFFRKSVEKIQVSLKYDKKSEYFTWRQLTFMTLSQRILLRIRNASDEGCRGNQNTIFMSYNFFPPLSPLQKIVPFVRDCRKTQRIHRGHRWQSDACALHAK
jgi:hypothetical protein